jgi:hypothetical protein
MSDGMLLFELWFCKFHEEVSENVRNMAAGKFRDGPLLEAPFGKAR